MNISVLGGVGEYGRNCFVLTASNTCIMLDCGVRNGEPQAEPPITEEMARSVQAVFISHTHNDHIGALPLLASKGFQGDVWMSEASLAQLTDILPNWPDAPIDQLRFRTFPSHSRGDRVKITNELSITWGYSGHMLGSLWYTFHVNKETAFFSGDFALRSPLLETDWPAQIPYDVALLDSGHAALSMPYERSLQNLASNLADPLEAYAFPITLSGKASDLAFSLFKLFPDRIMYLDAEFHRHLVSYLFYKQNVRQESLSLLEVMLTSNRLQIATAEKKPGLYFARSFPTGWTIVHIGVYENESSPFYKSHPDRSDLETILERIESKKLIFFHSTASDLAIITNQRIQEVF
ncbi:MBL fold metallo-hydrolase [Rossellomorea marisflavi]|uniref:MBL fold metallo-hydrolase n=1 Tax=Rossellomorea marisflavi TaxID=189381 RepID=UPI0034575FD1